MRALVVAVVLLMSTPVLAVAQAPDEPAITADARAFMEGYARDLLAGDRDAVAGRYRRSGAWIVHAGQARAVSHDAVIRQYVDAWEPPTAFEWRDLVFIPSGQDAVTVVGRFLWTSGDEAPELISYHGQFVREDGELRILVEDEARVPAE